MIPQYQPSNYRPDIDGLRALAVISVIIAHFQSSILPSGFLGVDMFFVISGYVITHSLYRSNSNNLGEFLIGFYERRVKRLAPALVLCVVITSFLICLFNPNPSTSLKTGFAALFGLSNIYLFTQATDYFGTAAQLNVFTHTWSLGVEEQFYLLFPFLLWFTGIGRASEPRLRTSVVVLGALTILSLAAFILLSHTNQPAAYFLMPPRFWELSAGALLFLVLNNRPNYLPALFGPHVSIFASAAIILVFLIPAEFSVYTTPAAVLLTMLLIASLRPNTAAYALFTHPIIVHIGLISYSLYLWHWSVLSISRWTIGVDWWSAPFQIALIFALAEMSYRYVERPLRHSRWSTSPSRTIGVGAAGLASAALALVILGKFLDDRLYTGTQPDLAAVGIHTITNRHVMPDQQSWWGGEDCVISNSSQIGKIISIEGCTLGDFDTAERRILVLGNSLSAAFVQAFDQLVLHDNYAVTIASAWATPPVPEIPHIGVLNKAIDYYWESVVPPLISRLKEGDWVFLVSDIQRLSPKDTSARAEEHMTKLEAGLVRLSDELAKQGVNLAVLHGKPFIRDAMCEPVTAMAQWFAPFGGPCLYYTKQQTHERRANLDATLSSLEEQGKIMVVDLLDVFCPGEICSYHGANGVILYRDAQSHPSVEGARLAAPHIRKAFLGSDKQQLVNGTTP
jgi:peptidoglycan/LPS O-acetylase OafA/YrhL